MEREKQKESDTHTHRGRESRIAISEHEPMTWRACGGKERTSNDETFSARPIQKIESTCVPVISRASEINSETRVIKQRFYTEKGKVHCLGDGACRTARD